MIFKNHLPASPTPRHATTPSPKPRHTATPSPTLGSTPRHTAKPSPQTPQTPPANASLATALLLAATLAATLAACQSNAPSQADAEQDGFSDLNDNCPLVANPDQADLDIDGVGNVCDIDIDGDNLIEIRTIEDFAGIALRLDGRAKVSLNSILDEVSTTTGCGRTGDACRGYELVNDIDLSSLYAQGTAGHSRSLGNCGLDLDCLTQDDNQPFSAILEGNGHTISNLRVRHFTQTAAFIGHLAADAQIRNVVFDNVDIIQSGVVSDGRPAPRPQTISNCTSVDIDDDSFPACAAAVVAWNEGGVHNVVVTSGTVQGTYAVGGLVSINRGTVSNSIARLSVNGVAHVGGVIGLNANGAQAIQLVSDAVVTGSSETGGLTGVNAGLLAGGLFAGQVHTPTPHTLQAVGASLATSTAGVPQRNIGALIGRSEPAATNTVIAYDVDVVSRHFGLGSDDTNGDGYQGEAELNQLPGHSFSAALPQSNPFAAARYLSAVSASGATIADTLLYCDTNGDGQINPSEKVASNLAFVVQSQYPVLGCATPPAMKAAQIASAAELDSDSDGIVNANDNCPLQANPRQDDDDADATGNACDAFAQQAGESVDSDGDGTGDNADTDDDNDGIADTDDAHPFDHDNDGISDNRDADDDNDGVADTLDIFPLNTAENTDFDNDGFGNSADPDDDNDGVIDTLDAFPLDACATTDTDADTRPDNLVPGCFSDKIIDTDDDNDGIADTRDAFPRDACATNDTDDDGQPDEIISDCTTTLIADTDDDNDNVADTDDAYPLDACASANTDGDAQPDDIVQSCTPTLIADTDDDGDGTPDTTDAFPKDKCATADTDDDNIPDSITPGCLTT
ncbi:MAG: MSCRAMM family adhesin SdrC, partial [Gammaproteobacteria bacterium]|nr:MSCRAMM family adhesin SdrC [Gammaproteobacteria bacterium]